MVEIVFAVVEKMFSAFKIVIFLVEKTIGVSQKHFCVAPTLFFASEKCFSITEKIVGEARTPFGLTKNPAFLLRRSELKVDFLFWAFKPLKKLHRLERDRNRKGL